MRGKHRNHVKGSHHYRWKSGSAVERFWQQVDKSQDCWIWCGGTNGTYGVFWWRENGKTLGAHIFSWFLKSGELPLKGLEVCHSCDVPLCVRPTHLFLGTHKDNALDAKLKNRAVAPPHFIGVNHPRAKLNESLVVKIRQRHEQEKLSAASLASLYGVSESTVYHALVRDTWRHV